MNNKDRVATKKREDLLIIFWRLGVRFFLEILYMTIIATTRMMIPGFSLVETSAEIS